MGYWNFDNLYARYLCATEYVFTELHHVNHPVLRRNVVRVGNLDVLLELEAEHGLVGAHLVLVLRKLIEFLNRSLDF